MNAAQDQKTLDFIEKAKKIHGDRYDYNKVLYKNTTDKIEIICREHGSFMQSPSKHLQGKGCSRCAGKNKTTKDFIQEAKAVHGEQFDYSKTEYKGKRKPVVYECKLHGIIDFQSPMDHLRSKHGCPKCGGNIKKDTEQITKEFEIIHGTNFDYSKVQYKNNKTKVVIKCNLCNYEFFQTPSAHLSGKGCPKCIGRNFTRTEMIEKMNQTHNFKYDYSNSFWKTKKDTIKIICPIHGEFLQKLDAHVSGKECSKCGKIKARKSRLANYTHEDFMKDILKVHGNKYDYGGTRYISKKSKISVICKIHGEFLIPAFSHLNGINCPLCVKEASVKSRTMNPEDFFNKCKVIHDNKYIYERNSYKTMTKTIIYFCQIHGKKTQQAQSHLKGSGCNECAELERRNTRRTNAEIAFWEQVKEFGVSNKYDLSKFKYMGAFKKSIAICKKHGEFKISADNLKRGKGCRKCRESIGEKIISEWLSFNKIEFIDEAIANHYFGDSLFVADIKRTKYDFLLPKEKMILEFDGEQHFTYADFKGKRTQKSYDEWLTSLKRDDLKDELAHNSGYKVIRIPFWERDNIEDILDQLLIKKDSSIHARYSLSQNRFRYEMIYLVGIKNEDEWEHYFNNLNDEDL